jgi:regulation of enolase protein 1 (concanavalin A-like superfamily)
LTGAPTVGFSTRENWVKVRHIPDTLKGYNGDDKFNGDESYGDPKNNGKAWAVKFKNFFFDTVKVFSMDGSYQRIYDRATFEGKMQEVDEFLKNK